MSRVGGLDTESLMLNPMSSAPRSAIRRAICPPFMREICRRTALISKMAAPDFSRISVAFCSSSKEMPSTGQLIKAEEPPLITHRNRSSSAA